MGNNMFSMGDCFSSENAREELIKQLKEKGISNEEIERLISMCDEMYKEHKTPYPTIDDIFKEDAE